MKQTSIYKILFTLLFLVTYSSSLMSVEDKDVAYQRRLKLVSPEASTLYQNFLNAIRVGNLEHMQRYLNEIVVDCVRIQRYLDEIELALPGQKIDQYIHIDRLDLTNMQMEQESQFGSRFNNLVSNFPL
jgi:hypothetical protein